MSYKVYQETLINALSPCKDSLKGFTILSQQIVIFKILIKCANTHNLVHKYLDACMVVWLFTQSRLVVDPESIFAMPFFVSFCDWLTFLGGTD